jgi:UDP-3-O-acyl N-acetylglucosamine deacetylase
MRQKTIKEKVPLTGRGLHSGEPCKLVFHPAEENHGLVFLIKGKLLPASLEFVAATERGTTLAKDDLKIQLTEHVLAACYGLGIDNLVIELSSFEPPALDGSALPFVSALQSGKIIEQAAAAKTFTLKKQIAVSTEKASIVALPHRGLKIFFAIDFNLVGAQQYEIEITEKSFATEIAPARTFGYVAELDALKKQGLAQGASLENALAIGPHGYVNVPRFADELVRHKILDLIGDLALAGKKIEAEFRCEKSGHALNVALARKMINDIIYKGARFYG